MQDVLNSPWHATMVEMSKQAQTKPNPDHVYGFIVGAHRTKIHNPRTRVSGLPAHEGCVLINDIKACHAGSVRDIHFDHENVALVRIGWIQIPSDKRQESLQIANSLAELAENHVIDIPLMMMIDPRP